MRIHHSPKPLLVFGSERQFPGHCDWWIESGSSLLVSSYGTLSYSFVAEPSYLASADFSSTKAGRQAGSRTQLFFCWWNGGQVLSYLGRCRAPPIVSRLIGCLTLCFVKSGPLRTWARNGEGPLTFTQRCWVLGKPWFCVVTGPQIQCEVRMDYVEGGTIA